MLKKAEEVINECRKEIDKLWKHYDEAKKAHLNVEANATIGKIIGIEWVLERMFEGDY